MKRLSDTFRWGVRRILASLPRRTPIPVGDSPHEILILFAGTFGDFVQLLPMLATTSALWPKARVCLVAPPALLKAFAFALPPRVMPGGKRDLIQAWFKPVPLLMTNVVGVYRVRYEVMAWRLGKMAAGFRYHHEKYRSGFGMTLPLTPEVANFGELNQLLPVAVAARKLPTEKNLPLRVRVDASQPFPFRGQVLFSVGSAGFKKQVGLTTYLAMIDEVVGYLGSANVTFCAGPDDAREVAHLQEKYGHRPCWRHGIEALSEQLSGWPGALIGFNSFIAHFALYLGRRMVVLHQDEIPYGYDCAPFHRQLVIASYGVVDLSPLSAFLDEVNWGQELPPKGRLGQNLP